MAKLLAWHKNTAGIEDLINEIRRNLKENSQLPERKGAVWGNAMPPDHGIMPESVHLINAVSRTGSKKTVEIITEIVERICISKRDYTNSRQGLFYYILSISYISEELRYKELVAPLRKLLSLPEFEKYIQKDGFNSDTLADRLAYLVLSIARALMYCGDEQGTKILTEFLEDNRTIFVKSAFRALKL